MNHKITETQIIKEQLIVNESLFTIGNGYIGIRGNFEEGYGDLGTIRGSYINAFYDIVDISYPEKAYAFPEKVQRQLNAIDAQTLLIELEEGEIVSALNDKITEYIRTLDLDEGVVTRSFIYHTKKQKTLKVTFKRMISFVKRELFITELVIEPITYFGKVKVRSTINGDVENYTEKDDPRVASGHSKHLKVVSTHVEPCLSVVAKTQKSNLICTCSSELRNTLPVEEVWVAKCAYELSVEESHQFELKEKTTLTKYVVYTDTLRHEAPQEEGLQLLEAYKAFSFEGLRAEQATNLELFWKDAFIEIKGDKTLQEGLRFNVFHLLQSVGKDRYSNIAAKGLTGEGYEGHYFWDTEIFILPVFILTHPEIAKNLLMYRYNILEHAKERAREMGHKAGALFPWRTISGTECSSYFPAGTAQYHISGDIAYAFISYYLATGDLEFMLSYGAEVLFETSRLWIEVGHEINGQFNIDCVTGPDEYTAIVNNNFYTNTIAKYNLYWAHKIYIELIVNYPQKVTNQLLERLDLSVKEIQNFKEISNMMYLPYDQLRDLNPQDDSFLSKKVWDFEGTKANQYPLLLNFHPLTIYRHQVLKQADAVLSHFLLEDYASESTIKNSYDYYEKLTTHDSSLAYCISSIMACKLGYKQKAYEYFMETARLDLDNTHNNTKDGLHMANMGGSFMGIIYGFGGLRIKEEGISFRPMLTDEWEGYSFKVKYQGRVIQLEVDKKSVRVQVEGAPLEIRIYDQIYFVKDELVVDLRR